LDLSFTNSSLLLFLSVLGFSLLVITTVGPTNGYLVPSRYQTLLEGI
jgi:hypothetical protein